MSVRFWLGVVSANHVERGVAGGFAQVCHGKLVPLRRMQVGDVLFYYSPRSEMRGGQAVQAFTAVGRVVSLPYRFAMSADFVPHRVDVDWLPAQSAPIRPLLARLQFVHNAPQGNWAYLLHRGHFEMGAHDARLIAHAMRTPLMDGMDEVFAQSDLMSQSFMQQNLMEQHDDERQYQFPF